MLSSSLERRLLLKSISSSRLNLRKKLLREVEKLELPSKRVLGRLELL